MIVKFTCRMRLLNYLYLCSPSHLEEELSKAMKRAFNCLDVITFCKSNLSMNNRRVTT